MKEDIALRSSLSGEIRAFESETSPLTLDFSNRRKEANELYGTEKLQECLYALPLRQRRNEARRKSLISRCLFCIGGTERDARHIECCSLNCSVWFAKNRVAMRDKQAVLEDLRKDLEQ